MALNAALISGWPSMPLALNASQCQTQPSTKTTDVTAAIRAVIEGEEAAIAQYKKIIRATEGEDYVTQDLCVRLLSDEEGHLVLFKGFLKEYTQGA
jgi:bacterioferritin